MTDQNDRRACPSCRATKRHIDRRSLLRLGAIGLSSAVIGSSLAPRRLLAANNPKYLVLSCIDDRLTDNVSRYMDSRGLRDRYQHVALAGAALGAYSDRLDSGKAAFWDNLETAIKQHDIRQVCLLDHRDCDAYKVILGADLAMDPAEETLVHGKVMKDLAKQIRDKYPHLYTEIRLMALDGSVQTIW